MGLGLENLTDAVFDVEEEVVDKPLDVCLRLWGGQGAQTRREHPYVEVRHHEPRLERWGKMTLW